jgi:hypothetical protein
MQVTYGPEFNLAVSQNAPHKVKFRQDILTVQEGMQKMIADGEMEDKLPDCTLTHYFSPVSEDYGCSTYARQMFIPKGTLIIGKIHRHQHLNFIMKGKVSVMTEFGKKYFEAPCGFVSEVGLKRAVVAEEDTVWMTVHVTKYCSESDLDKVEAELIAPSYDEMGLLDDMRQLERITS